MKAAVAAMVKTPSLSGVKTRLAQAIGRARAEQFYDMSLDCIEEFLLSLPVSGDDHFIVPLWAVAEPEGAADPRWRHLPIVFQGAGGLGDRMHQVYTHLLRLFPAAILIGADSPQLSASHLHSALDELTAGADFVFGPADDGGFYLLAGKAPIPLPVFNAVEYSTATAMLDLERQLQSLGVVSRIAPECDVDREEDLISMNERLQSEVSVSRSQIKMLNWLQGATLGRANLLGSSS